MKHCDSGVANRTLVITKGIGNLECGVVVSYHLHVMAVDILFTYYSHVDMVLAKRRKHKS